ncbi:MAG: efflux RND transporter periplasmic adaptor subunit [Pseudomonadota bacterium]
MARPRLRPALPLAIVLAGVALRAEAPAAAAEAEDPPVPVTVTVVANESLSPGVPAAGTVFSRNAAQVTAGLEGRLAWVAEPGDVVAAGEPVARFDCELLTLRRDELEAIADRERLRADHLGIELGRLERGGAASPGIERDRLRGERDLARGELRVARLRVRQTDAELKRCVERAPFDGVITRRVRRGGEDVTRGDVLAAMTDTQALEVRASVPIRHLPRTRTGVAVQVRIADQRLTGTVRTAVPAADATSQTFEVRIDLPASAPAHVAAGQLVSVTLPLASEPVLTVPRDSIVLRADGTYVMRIDSEDKAEPVRVEVDDASGERVAVRGALKHGDRIAVRGAEALDAGERVVVL